MSLEPLELNLELSLELGLQRDHSGFKQEQPIRVEPAERVVPKMCFGLGANVCEQKAERVVEKENERLHREIV